MEGQIGIDIVLWLQALCPIWLSQAFGVFNWLGGLWFFLLVLPLIFWCIDKSLGRRATVAVVFAVWANGALKTVVSQPRPFEVSSGVIAAFQPEGGGMPSGHAMTSALFWGLLALFARRPWVTVVASLLVLLVGLSRVVHGVHFPGDVLVGWTLGGVLLLLVHRVAPRCEAFVASRSTPECFAVVVALPVVLGSLWPFAVQAEDPRLHALGLTMLGLMLGTGVGFMVESRLLRIGERSRQHSAVVRYLVGVGLLVAVFAAMKALVSAVVAPSTALEVVMRLGRYAALGLLLSAGIPWGFMKLGWSEHQ